MLEMFSQNNILTEEEFIKQKKGTKKQYQILIAKYLNAKISLSSLKTKPIVFNEDCLTFIKRFEDKSIDLLLTDPPYSTDVNNIEEFSTWLPLALNKVKDTGLAYVFIGNYINEMKAYLNLNYPEHIKLEQMLTWFYKNTLGVLPNERYSICDQKILFFKSINAKMNFENSLTEERLSVFEINAPDGRMGNKFHAWQKPELLANYFIKHSCREGSTIIDPFCCTGTFLISASKNNCKAFGCDINKENLNIAIERGCKYETI